MRDYSKAKEVLTYINLKKYLFIITKVKFLRFIILTKDIKRAYSRIITIYK